MLVLTMAVASAIVFTVLEVLPGDPALLILGVNAQEDTLAALRAEMGFDRPALVRYVTWVGGFFTGHLGISHTYSVPVAELIGERLVITVPLALLAFVLSTAVAVPLGMYAATHDANGQLSMLAQRWVGVAQKGIDHIALKRFGLLGRVNKVAVLCNAGRAEVIGNAA